MAKENAAIPHLMVLITPIKTRDILQAQNQDFGLEKFGAFMAQILKVLKMFKNFVSV